MVVIVVTATAAMMATMVINVYVNVNIPVDVDVCVAVDVGVSVNVLVVVIVPVVAFVVAARVPGGGIDAALGLSTGFLTRIGTVGNEHQDQCKRKYDTDNSVHVDSPTRPNCQGIGCRFPG
jgi:hypothetical protein